MSQTGSTAHEYDVVVVSAGQGVQRPGMLDPWVEASPRAVGLLSQWSAAAGLDLLAASRDEQALSDTADAQPVIVAAALLSLDLMRAGGAPADHRMLFAGHSVGELAAAAGAGYLAADDAVALARARGAAMSAACRTASTGMAAVVPAKREGAPDDVIEAAIRATGLSVANWNGSHQFVAAGPVDRLEAFADASPPGMRVMRLDVAGAFHTEAMAAATVPFADAIARVRFQEPAAAMLSNADGGLVTGPDDLRRRLIGQITSAVRWDLCSATVAQGSGPGTVHVELAPAGPLTSLVERSRPGVRTVALRNPDDVGKVRSAPAVTTDV